MNVGVMLPVERLRAHCDPFLSCPWDNGPVTRELVKEALEAGRLVSQPGTSDHAGRIAYLVVNEASDPIEVDVGVPVLRYWPDWIVLDGNHRLAAAIYADRSHIMADVGGQMDYAEELFGVDCSRKTPSTRQALELEAASRS